MAEKTFPVSATASRAARPDLRLVYRIMIRAYMRQQNRTHAPNADEVAHG